MSYIQQKVIYFLFQLYHYTPFHLIKALNKTSLRQLKKAFDNSENESQSKQNDKKSP